MASTTEESIAENEADGQKGSLLEVLWVATRLGLTSFGGPVAHLGYFRDEYVVRRRWLSESAYADLVALCQFLPGPASSQVGIAIGMMRAGLLGGLISWLGFTLPSAIVLLLFAAGIEAAGVTDAGWLHGLKVVAVAVVAYAVWGMARTLAPDKERATIAIVAAIVMLAWQTTLTQVGVIAVGAFVGWRLLPGAPRSNGDTARMRLPFGPRLAIASLVVFLALLMGLPIARQLFENQSLAVVDSFYRVGSLVFGGGHVVLPLLQTEVVPPGWVTNDQFIAGYGAAQAVPGPLFSFAAFLGSVMGPVPNGMAGAAIALAAIYVPSFLLVVGTLHFWDRLRSLQSFQSALRGVNAAVVGLLLAALYTPVWTSAINEPADVALGLAAFALLAFWRVPPWLVVVLAAAGGQAIAAF
ncbi:MAG: chromate efflux transporter [Dehalococcoidia bacterium]